MFFLTVGIKSNWIEYWYKNEKCEFQLHKLKFYTFFLFMLKVGAMKNVWSKLNALLSYEAVLLALPQVVFLDSLGLKLSV